jgi:glucose-1-phosphate cytidylyltransferase
VTEPLPVSEIPVVLLAGGMGTRLREASGDKIPKPMVDIGGRPVLWHVMKMYQAHGFRKFVICLGYKSDVIKRFFLDYRAQLGDFTLTHDGAEPVFHSAGPVEDWEITFVETGLQTGTVGRVKRVAEHLKADQFMLTYGDGVGDVDITKVVETHRAAGRLGTVTAVHPTSRYGEMHVADGQVVEFNEKPTLATGWVNGGFFMFERSFIDKYLNSIEDDSMMLEQQPLQELARDGELTLNGHEGFWLGMDTYRDWTELNKMWDRGEASWKFWED